MEETQILDVPAHNVTTNGFYQTSLTPTIPNGYELYRAEVFDKNSAYSIATAYIVLDANPKYIRVAEIGATNFSSAFKVRATFRKAQ